MADARALENRVRKNARHLARWAARQGLTAYRVYDRDIPDLPYAVDWYAGHVHVAEYPKRGLGLPREVALSALSAALGVSREQVAWKTHAPKVWGKTQYERQDKRGDRLVVEENGLKFWVNLTDYLDTGLFFDHRNTRARVRGEASGRRVLNLFCYTGAFTVYAAAGGAEATTSVDLSGVYLDWARENLLLNGLDAPRHQFVRADVLGWLEQARRDGLRYDLVVLDPPSFSSSEKMAGTLEVQRDHGRLLKEVAELLSGSGVLYFSTNFRSFELTRPPPGLAFEELTPRSLPEDFHDRQVHRCWRFVSTPAGGSG